MTLDSLHPSKRRRDAIFSNPYQGESWCIVARHQGWETFLPIPEISSGEKSRGPSRASMGGKPSMTELTSQVSQVYREVENICDATNSRFWISLHHPIGWVPSLSMRTIQEGDTRVSSLTNPSHPESKERCIGIPTLSSSNQVESRMKKALGLGEWESLALLIVAPVEDALKKDSCLSLLPRQADKNRIPQLQVQVDTLASDRSPFSVATSSTCKVPTFIGVNSKKIRNINLNINLSRLSNHPSNRPTNRPNSHPTNHSSNPPSSHLDDDPIHTGRPSPICVMGFRDFSETFGEGISKA